MNEIDEELVKVIDEAISGSSSYVDALDKVVEWKKKNRGLKGIHISPSLDLILNPDDCRKIDPKVEANKMAHDVLLMLRASAKGELKEVPMSELERM